jgi:uncharacterized protein YndB with AHSA1/START domain
MADIAHKITINAPRDQVFRALTTLDGLAGWWTSTVGGESALGKVLEFRFGEHASHMRVNDLDADRRVVWECTRSAPDWVGTQLTFDLSEEAGRTSLRFGHRGWQEAGDFFAHCSTKWATFLLSLRDYVETGAGRPFPRDVAI